MLTATARRFYLGCTLVMLCILVLTPAKAQELPVVKSHNMVPFNQALAGFVDACDDRITEYDLHGSRKMENQIIKRIKASKPRLILAIGTLAAQVVKESVSDIPVIFFMVPNPRKYGLEGKNMAGISLDIPVETQFSVYQSLIPNLRTIGVVYDPRKTGAMITRAAAVANTLGLRLVAVPVDSEKALPAALRSMLGKIDALWMVPDDTVVTPESFQFLLLQAFENNLPFLAVSDIFVQVGALASLSPDYTDVGRQGCQLAREINSGRLRLTEVNALPPSKINLAINLKTAIKIGLTVPSEVIKSASKVYR